MITLNSEKELVRIESWDDVESRPGFVTDVDPTLVELESIIGSYVFLEDQQCGLSNCHQPHKRGYLVSIKGGHETNIGNVCGKNNFGVDFETLRRRFDRDVRIKTHREILEAYKSRLQEYEDHLESLLNEHHGAIWINKWLTNIRTRGRGFPEPAQAELVRMIRDGNPALTIERRATEREIDALEAAEGRELPRPHFIASEVGTLNGFACLGEAGDLRSLLVLDVKAGLSRLQQLSVENASEHQLAMEVRWVGELDSKLERANALVEAGRRFLTKQNLMQFSQVLDQEDQIALREFAKELPDTTAE